MQLHHKFFIFINALFFTHALYNMNYDIDQETRNTIVNNPKEKSAWVDLGSDKKIKSGSYCPKTEEGIVAYSTKATQFSFHSSNDAVTISLFDLQRQNEQIIVQSPFDNPHVQYLGKEYFGFAQISFVGSTLAIYDKKKQTIQELQSNQGIEIFNRNQNHISYPNDNKVNIYDSDKKKNTVLNFSTKQEITYQTFDPSTNKVALILEAPDKSFESSTLLLFDVDKNSSEILEKKSPKGRYAASCAFNDSGKLLLVKYYPEIGRDYMYNSQIKIFNTITKKMVSNKQDLPIKENYKTIISWIPNSNLWAMLIGDPGIWNKQKLHYFNEECIQLATQTFSYVDQEKNLNDFSLRSFEFIDNKELIVYGKEKSIIAKIKTPLAVQFNFMLEQARNIHQLMQTKLYKNTSYRDVEFCTATMN